MLSLYVLHAFIALTTFLIPLNSFVRGANEGKNAAYLFSFLLGLIIACFVGFGWIHGLIGIALTFVYSSVCTPLAARLAAKLHARFAGLTMRGYVGHPPPALLDISHKLATSFEIEETLRNLTSAREGDAEDALFNYCAANPGTRQVMSEFNVTRVELSAMYSALLKGG